MSSNISPARVRFGQVNARLKLTSLSGRVLITFLPQGLQQGNRQFLNLTKDEHLVRLHIGLEDPKDLIEDLRKSLKFVK